MRFAFAFLVENYITDFSSLLLVLFSDAMTNYCIKVAHFSPHYADR